MMTAAIRKLLDAADHPVHVESDPDQDWLALHTAVAALKVEFEHIAGREYKLKDNAQDATFYADLASEKPGPKPNWIDTVFAVRFSNFGRVCTTWSHCETEHLPDEIVAELLLVARKAGFQFIPPSALDAVYSGRNPGFAGSTWGIRFFDWV